MTSLVNSIKHLNKKQWQSYTNFFRKDRKWNHFPILLWRQHNPNTKFRHRHTRKENDTSIHHEPRHKRTATGILQYIKNTILHEQVRFVYPRYAK